jgi:hypothetical protein
VERGEGRRNGWEIEREREGRKWPSMKRTVEGTRGEDLS